VFSKWQPEYAEHGIATIPVSPEKKPLVLHPQKFGCKASAEIASKFPDAQAFGYYTGPQSGITVLDVDTPDESILAAALDRHGQTPLLVRTGSEKFHALYRHNGERRSIRAWGKESPIDLLGGGLCIAPPSVVTKGQYEIIQGSLDDLDRLPIMRELEDRLYSYGHVGPRPQPLKKGEGRNNDLWRRAMREAHHVNGVEQLLDRVKTLNEEFLEPMEQAEVTKIAKSAWGYTERGENRFGQYGVWFPTQEANELIETAPREFILLAYLRANNGQDSTFMAANGLVEKFGWKRHTLAAARESLIQRGYLKPIRQASQHTPALYRWPIKREKQRENGVR
jgi:Bifunctional DNA primase/polymerase, N-terminal/Primase C terminal 1 (PriCT-1)